jgi:uncharacterized protein (TIGR01244 family)
MTDFRTVTPDFAVAPQVSVDDFAQAAALGYRTIINNRPDGEAPGQLSAQEAEQAAKAAGLAYHSLPFSGAPPPGAVARTAELLEEVEGPVLAYCRSGTRSVTAWAMAQALVGALSPDEIIALAAKAGYDLNGARGALEGLSPGSG